MASPDFVYPVTDPTERNRYVRERSESPIEFRLAWALLFSHKFVIVAPDQFEDKRDPLEFAFVMQYPVWRYRLDIAVCVHTDAGIMRKIAIECDGARFHTGEANERRDRSRDFALSEAGFEVWRYPGWLLHHAPDCAADEIREALIAVAKGAEPVLTFSRGHNAKAPTLREYEAAFWAFQDGVAWPARMGKNPEQRGWVVVEDLIEWANDQEAAFPELEQ